MSTPADSQKLIAYGKQLEDNTKTLADYTIKENDFLVLFVTKVFLLAISSYCVLMCVA